MDDMTVHAVEDPRRSQRERNMTEKGLSYTMDIRRKDRLDCIKNLSALSVNLGQLLTETSDVSLVRTAYTQWLTKYEDLLLAHEECQKLLTIDGKQKDHEEFQETDNNFISLKQAVELWSSKHLSYASPTVSRRGGGSIRSGASSKASSQLSLAKMKENQRTVELLARAAALAEKQEIETEKLKLKMKEEEFEIKTELQVSDARTRVLEELERSELHDRQMEEVLANKGDFESEYKIADNQQAARRANVLNPDIPVWISQQNYRASDMTGDNWQSTPHISRTADLMPGNIGQSYGAAFRPKDISDDNRPSFVRTLPTNAEREVKFPFCGYADSFKPLAFGQPQQAPALPGSDARMPNNNDGGLSVARELNKPKAEIQTFNGSPMDYNRFIRQFNARVSANTDSYEERLNFLMQFTTGEAHKIVSGYSHLDAERGYKATLEEFEDRYGDPDVVTQAYVRKALDWPVVKPDSAKALYEYAIFLRECQFAVENVEAARVLEYSENLKLLVKKLPYYLHEKWRNIVYDTKERKQIVKFQQLVAFVRKEANKATDPVYGKEVMSTSNTINKHSQDKQFVKSTKFTGSRKNFATTAIESRKTEHPPGVQNNGETTRYNAGLAFVKPCLFCQGSSHSLDTCYGIMKQPLKDRYAFLQSKGLCFACLKSGHQKGSCRQKSVCSHCKKCHPTVLHLEPRKDYESGLATYEQRSVHPVLTTSSATRTGAGDTVHQALPIVPVRLKARSSDKFIDTYAFLDSGSTATFCSEEIMRALNVEGKKTKINLLTMGQEKVQSSYLVSGLEVCALNGDNVLKLPPVLTQTTLPVSRKDVISSEDLRNWSHLRGIPLERIDSDVGLLIGVNVPKAMEPWDVIPSVENSPFAVKTLLGWVINGPLDVASNSEVSSRFISVNRIDANAVPSLEEHIRIQFNHDFNERTIDDVLEPSKEDNQFLDVVSKSTRFENGHYVMDLPFKSKSVSMPNNRRQAEQRLASLARRLVRDDVFRNEYSNFMGKVIGEGYARKVPFEEMQQDDGQVWYLPHHGVYHPKKKKLRVVFDCAAKYRGTSLNDQLLQGPNLTNTLVGTLIRFRQEEIAVMGDIDSMFYQVHVPPQDASFLRFLWWENGDLSKQATEYQMVVHLFGATSSPSCASFALRKTAHDCKEHFNAEVIDTVLKNFYVDYCLKSVETVNDAVSLVKDLQDLLHQGGFHIAKWISNSREVMSSIPASDRAKEVKDLDLDQDILPIERALGVQWCVESDVFRLKVIIPERPLTRRGILSMVSSVFDPLGFLAPFMLRAKGILQELCRLQFGWDDKIPVEIAAKWYRWLKDLQELSRFKVDRCLKPKGFGPVKNAQLHHFSDASEVGYGTVSYLRSENAEGNAHCSFIMGKSRVAPLKQTTIPRLELTAATVAVRTDKMLKDELDIPIDRSVFWTDSMCVLRYVRNTTSRFHTFVANRLAVIHEGSSSDEWKYVNTKLNPADLASRGISSEWLLQGQQWIVAPDFLWESEDSWPQAPVEVSGNISNDDPEVKRVVMTTVASNTQTSEAETFGVDKLISHCSSWSALKRSVAWIIKIRKELLRRVRRKRTKTESSTQSESNHGQAKDEMNKRGRGSVSVQDMDDAEDAVLKFIQQQAFKDEIHALQSGRSHVKRSSYIRKLDPIIDDGLLRVGGRLDKSSMPAESKHPVILPKGHLVSTLILRQIHDELQHSGRNHMLSRLRQRFWLVNATSAIRKLLSKCVACRRQRSPVGEQKMANLPEDRVTPDEPPFTRVGVDYFGPFEVKQRRSRVKRYGVIFTCLASRAVHLEVAASLDTDSYINALRRFIARRGQVTKMRSDNGTNFVGAERELARAISEWNLSQIHNAMLQRHIDWQFNPPAGSHHGGVWERMIRTVRKVMNSVIREQVLDDEGLNTLMCEIESTINDRPITRNSDQYCDLEALTPNHLLLLKQKPNLPPGVFHKTDNYCKRRWRQVQYMADLFWQRWVREYLPLLQERQKWHEEKRNLKVGDVVLVVDSNAPRNSWPMGVILQTIPDRMGFVRQVKVKTATNTLIRPIDKLCLILEMD